MTKKYWIGVLLLLLFLTVACSSEESKSNHSNLDEKSVQQENKETPQESDSDQMNDLEEQNGEKQTEDTESNQIIKDSPPIPTSFGESAEYRIEGKFSVGERFTREFDGEDEIRKVLDSFPVLTDDATEEEREEVKRYLFSLFKEDLTKVDVPLDQWESMQFYDPEAESEVIQLKENYNVAILLDSSGSMANLENGKTRMELAKEAIQQFVEGLPNQANISLRVYGHVGTGSDADKNKSCAKIEEVYPLDNYDEGRFSEALNKFDPAGWTPMAAAIQQVEEDFSEFNGKENTSIIYVVSDGVETCDGDPVQSIKSLDQSNIDPVVNIIGYQVDNEGLDQLKEMAEASEGRYVNAKSQADLTKEFEQTVDMAKIWSEWQRESKDVVNKLHKTIRDQLNDWHNQEEEKMHREHNNLEAAVFYLHDHEIVSTKIYLQYIDDYRDYYLEIIDEATEQYLDLHDINTETFFEKYDEVEKRYKEARN